VGGSHIYKHIYFVQHSTQSIEERCRIGRFVLLSLWGGWFMENHSMIARYTQRKLAPLLHIHTYTPALTAAFVTPKVSCDDFFDFFLQTVTWVSSSRKAGPAFSLAVY
jgi:hypothetical protein